MASKAASFKQWLAGKRGLDEAMLRRELERLDIDQLDRWAFGVIGDQIIKIDPKDIAVVHFDDLDNAKHQADRYPGGRKAWARGFTFDEPVDISVTEPGAFVLEDGHHRYLAAKTLGRKLPAKIRIKGKPIEVLLAQSKAA